MAYIHQISKFDIDNDFGKGPVVSVFFNFCSFHCIDCWNESTWERQENLYLENDTVVEILKESLLKLVERGMKPNLSLLGGDPIVPENIDDTIYIISKLTPLVPNLQIAIWTGFDVENWYKRPDKYKKQFSILSMIDYLIDGQFMKGLKTKNHMFGSINQRVIETKTLSKSNKPVKDAIAESLRSDFLDEPLQLIGSKTTHTAREFIDLYLNGAEWLTPSDLKSYGRLVTKVIMKDTE